MTKQTKIVATISDKRCDVDFLKQLYDAGMNVVRLNSAHLDEIGLTKIITNVRAVSNRIALLLDTKGPEVRTTTVKEPVSLSAGDKIYVKGDITQETSRECIYVSYPNFVNDLSLGTDLLIDDGDLDLKVIEKAEDKLVCKVLNNGVLGSRKSVNVPGVRINLPSLTEKDKKNIVFAIENKLDFIAHSFVRTKQDVIDIQRILNEHQSDIKIIAKIENQEGVDNIDEILEHAFGIMIARGDLGIEVAQEKIPGIQRVLIRKCVQAHKPVIVATQMLHSMINNPRPTRAEVTDIANAIFYRTDALMLSGETAYGKYPLEAVQTMAKIAEEAEKTKLSDNDIKISFTENEMDTTTFLSKQAVKSANKLGVKAIITDSYTGRTALCLAAYRGKNPILAICYREQTTRFLALSYGVIPIYQKEMPSTRAYFFAALELLMEKNLISIEDPVAYLTGSFGESGGTTFLEINQVNKILGDKEKFCLPHFS